MLFFQLFLCYLKIPATVYTADCIMNRRIEIIIVTSTCIETFNSVPSIQLLFWEKERGHYLCTPWLEHAILMFVMRIIKEIMIFMVRFLGGLYSHDEKNGTEQLVAIKFILMKLSLSVLSIFCFLSGKIFDQHHSRRYKTNAINQEAKKQATNWL